MRALKGYMAITAWRQWVRGLLGRAPAEVQPELLRRVESARATTADGDEFGLAELVRSVPRSPWEMSDATATNSCQRIEPAGIRAFRIVSEVGCGTTCEFFESELAGGREIVIGLDCLGGDAAEGIRLHGLLERYRPTCVVLNFCGSAGVDLLLAGARRLAHRDAKIILHSPAGMCFGGPGRMREEARVLEEAKGRLCAFYAKHTKQPAERVLGWFDGAEHWFSAREALDAGLLDAVFSDWDGWPQRLFRPSVPPAARQPDMIGGTGGGL